MKSFYEHRREGTLAAYFEGQRAEIIEDMQAFASEHGRAPTYYESTEKGWSRWTYATACKRFGSWNKAIEAAGLSPRALGVNLRTGKGRNRPADSQILHGNERESYGVTVTFASADERQIFTMARVGLVKAALGELLEEVPPRYSVLSISTPNTIYADLKARRRLNGPPIESALLARIGKTGRLHPALWPRASHDLKRVAAAAALELETWRER